MQTDLEVDYRYALEDAEDRLTIRFAGQDIGEGQLSFTVVGMPREWTNAVAELLNGQNGHALEAVGGDLLQNGIKDRLKLTRVEISYNDDNFAERYFNYQKTRERWLQGQELPADDPASENKRIQESVEKLVELGFPKDPSIEFVEAAFAFVKEPDEFEFEAELDGAVRDGADVKTVAAAESEPEKSFFEKKVNSSSKPEEMLLGKWKNTSASEGEVWEFFEDNSMTATFQKERSGLKTISGGWIILKDGRLKVSFTVMGTTTTLVGNLHFSGKNTLELIDDNGSKTVLTRLVGNQANNSGNEEDALSKEARNLGENNFYKSVTKCGNRYFIDETESFTYYQHFRYKELKDITIEIEPDKRTKADEANGIEWNGVVKVSALERSWSKYSSSAGHNDSPILDIWRGTQGFPYASYQLIKSKGKWAFGRGDEITEVKKAFDCSNQSLFPE
jgi:hypothetical protein